MDKRSLWILVSIIILLVVAVAGYYFMRNDYLSPGFQSAIDDSPTGQGNQCWDLGVKRHLRNPGESCSDWCLRIKRDEGCDFCCEMRDPFEPGKGIRQGCWDQCEVRYNLCLENCKPSPPVG